MIGFVALFAAVVVVVFVALPRDIRKVPRRDHAIQVARIVHHLRVLSRLFDEAVPVVQEFSRAMLALFKSAGANYALLGAEERCCGDPARRLGDEGLFQDICRQNIAVFNKYGIKKIVTSCPHCFHVLKNEYPSLDGSFDVYHHAHFLTRLLESNALHIPLPRERLSVFYQDPCYLGRYNGNVTDARTLIDREAKAGLLNPAEGDQAFCCGGGGGQMWLDVRKGERIENVRMNQIETSRPDTIATACPYCKIMFDSALASRAARGEKWSPPIKDIAELLAENL